MGIAEPSRNSRKGIVTRFRESIHHLVQRILDDPFGSERRQRGNDLPRDTFVDYARRMTDRDAYRRAKEIDSSLLAELQAQQQLEQPQPA